MAAPMRPWAHDAQSQRAKTTLFARAPRSNVREMAARVRPWAHDAQSQRAKTTLFARAPRSNVRKMAKGHFSN
jgi:hypothetical protein